MSLILGKKKIDRYVKKYGKEPEGDLSDFFQLTEKEYEDYRRDLYVRCFCNNAFSHGSHAQVKETFYIDKSIAYAFLNNTDASIKRGDNYHTNVVPCEGYEIKNENVRVTMGGVDITNEAWDGQSITITNVSADISLFIYATVIIDDAPGYSGETTFSLSIKMDNAINGNNTVEDGEALYETVFKPAIENGELTDFSVANLVIKNLDTNAELHLERFESTLTLENGRYSVNGTIGKRQELLNYCENQKTYLCVSMEFVVDNSTNHIDLICTFPEEALIFFGNEDIDYGLKCSLVTSPRTVTDGVLYTYNGYPYVFTLQTYEDRRASWRDFTNEVYYREMKGNGTIYPFNSLNLGEYYYIS